MNNALSARTAFLRWKVFLVIGTLLSVAGSSVNAAEPATSSPRLAQYVSDIRSAQQTLDGGQRERAQMILKQYLEQSGEEDVRGFEWRYLWRACQSKSGPETNPIERKGLVERNPLSPLIFTSDSRVLMSACADTIARQFDVRTLDEVMEMAGVRDPLHLCSDGHTLIASGYSGLQVWDLRSQVLAPIWFFPRGGNWAVSCFSPDGRWGVVHHSSGQLQFIDVVHRQELANVRAHAGPVRALAFSPDRRTVASGGADGIIKLWDFASHTQLDTLKSHTGTVTCLIFSPDGRQLSSAGLDHQIRIWTIGSQTEPRHLDAHRDTVWALAYSPDGKTLASGSGDGSVRLWNTALGAELVTLGTLSGAKEAAGRTTARLAFSPDGSCLATRLFDGTLLLWRTRFTADATPATGL